MLCQIIVSEPCHDLLQTKHGLERKALQVRFWVFYTYNDSPWLNQTRNFPSHRMHLIPHTTPLGKYSNWKTCETPYHWENENGEAHKVRLPHQPVGTHTLVKNKMGKRFKSYLSELKVLKQTKLPFNKVNKDLHKEKAPQTIERHAVACLREWGERASTTGHAIC